MKLSDYWDTFYVFSGRASDVSRQLAFAGVAIIWLFHNNQNSPITIPDTLVPLLLIFVCALAFDLLQYIAASIIWGLFCRQQEKKLHKITDNPIISAPWWINAPTNFFFIGKLIFILSGYYLLIKYFANLWLTSV